MLRYHRGADEFLSRTAKSRSEQTAFELHLGDPGTGKTEWVLRQYPEAYWKPPTSEKWYDDYENNEVVVFDEFKGWVPYAELNKLGDATPYTVQVKGVRGGKQFTARRLVMISNYHPDKWYNWEKHDQKALYRRLNRGGGIWWHWQDAEGYHAQEFKTLDELGLWQDRRLQDQAAMEARMYDD